jgi:hypothetical protein
MRRRGGAVQILHPRIDGFLDLATTQTISREFQSESWRDIHRVTCDACGVMSLGEWMCGCTDQSQRTAVGVGVSFDLFCFAFRAISAPFLLICIDSSARSQESRWFPFGEIS